MKRNSRSKKKDIEFEFISKIVSLFPDQITRVILFGSRAKGISKPGSDYDFLIVLKEKDRKTIDVIYHVVTDFLLEYGADVSLKIYSKKEFDWMISIPTPFMASILKTGRELWSPIPAT